MSEKFSDIPPQLSEEELQKLASRVENDAKLTAEGSQYVNSGEEPLLDVMQAREKSVSIEVISVFKKRAEVDRTLTQLDAVLPFIEEHNPAVAEGLKKTKEDLEVKSEEGERAFDLERLKSEIEDLNRTVQEGTAMSRFGSEHGFSKDETYAFVEKRVAENEAKIRGLEKAGEQDGKRVEIDILKAEINGLNKTVQESTAMAQYGADHGFSKDKTYAHIENKIAENESKIRELEGGETLESAVVEAQTASEPEVIVDASKADEAVDASQTNEPFTPDALVKQEKDTAPLTPEAQAVFVESYEEARGKKTVWGWIKERAKGFATFGLWEFRQAERFRRGRNNTAEEIAGKAEQISKVSNLSVEQAVEEAYTMRMMAEGGDISSPESPDYEKYSEIITNNKKEQNSRQIDAIVANSSTALKERLEKYRDEFGKVVVADDRMMTGFEGTLRNTLIELQGGQTESDTKAFNRIIQERLDPKYWRRYVYGALEGVLDAWGFKVILSSIAASEWWLGKKDAIPVLSPASPSPEVSPKPESADQLAMHDNIWKTSKEWLQNHGITNPTNNEIMSVDKQVSMDNGIEVKKWGLDGNPIDTKMQQGFLLKFKGASKILDAIRVARGL